MMEEREGLRRLDRKKRRRRKRIVTMMTTTGGQGRGKAEENSNKGESMMSQPTQ